MSLHRFTVGCIVSLISATPLLAQTPQELHWNEDGKTLIYQSQGTWYSVDVESGNRKSIKAEDVQGSLESIPRLSLPPRPSTNGGGETSLRIENQTDKSISMVWVDAARREHRYDTVGPGESFSQHTFIGHTWLLKSEGRSLGSFRARADEVLKIDHAMLDNVRREKRTERRSRRRRGTRGWGSPATGSESPDGKWKVSVRDDNLWLNETKLTEDGTAGHTFENVGVGTHWYDSARGPDVRWAPDSQFVVAFQTKNAEPRRVQIVESSPGRQLQPTVRSFEYIKPGDDLPEKTVRLFSATGNKEIPVSNELLKNPWSLRFVRWVDNGKKFWLHYNQRGHQVVRLVEVETSTGKSTALIEETSDTFIHYSNGAKSVFERLPGDSILWASERSGWNHLYRFEANGKLLNAVTEGDWNVKRIERIDNESETIWFYAVGVATDQDPYHEHFCRVNFDGEQFTVLTKGDGTHRVEFQQERKYLIDTYSRVDLAPVTELINASTGQKIADLDRRDTQKVFGERPLTTRFSTKGRDGETDIWGIIHWPKDFDPDATYPVIENIYAGPHDHHVPKRFSKRYRFQHEFADAGAIVVQIDGMGTAWRSKRFHDVCYQNLKDSGFPDRIAWMKAAAKKYPQMDLSRVGIYGGSAGGQSAMAALLWHNDFYKVAVADCGCHDNRMDKIWWNEQWMGWPVGESYAENSNMENAHLLKGHLMLTVGELDQNVDPATTTQVVKKLIDHDRDFEFVLIPGKGHGAGDSPWASRKRLNFFKRHLQME